MYVLAKIQFDGDEEEVIIAVGEKEDPKTDDYIFFYVNSEEELERLKEDGKEDFKLLEIKERYEKLVV